MNGEETLIHYRNQLMAKLLCCFLATSVLINAFVDPYILLYIVPTGVIICGSLVFLVWKKVNVVVTMYTIICAMFGFFFTLVIYEPLLVNFIYIWFALILSSIYKDYRPLIVAGLLTVSFTLYSFLTYKEEIFPAADSIDLIYIILFAILITVFFIYSNRLTELLRQKAEKKERRTAAELGLTKEYLESFISQTTDAIIVHDCYGKTLKINKAFETLYGWKESELIHHHVPVIPEANIEELKAIWAELEEGRQVSNFEIVTLRKNGEEVAVSVTISPIRNEEGCVIAIAAIIRDISERLKTEEFLRRSEKLSAVGQLAAGVAHEIRNPLSVISGYIQLLQKTDGTHQRKYDIMLTELKRINSIISEFLVLAKPNATKFEQHNVKTIIDEVITLLNTQAIMENVVIKSQLEPLLMIHCEANHLKQVLINLVKNAIEAMPDGGEVKVSAREYDHNQVLISIEDQGEGIPDEKLTHIGEPFFTTKTKGTGLGLMVSYKIIENHQGRMEINSKENKGTKVDIVLPATLHKEKLAIYEKSIS
ncbi:ATP-binding protein [Anaerobacillus sp. MEB173]|uniref:ATP-binding protein n=1 Tax=Anaerobacillus sp. MEB173 TaxID=3383345 RepID=UPI003F8E4A3B